jgi:hypothetical protein
MSSSSTEAVPTHPGRLWVVLPVFDEAAAIERVVAEWVPALAAADPGFVLLAIDDGSRDETPQILARLAAAEPRLRVHRQANAGHGAACRRGYELATAPGSDAAWVLQIDSDGQCDAADFAAFWEGRHAHPVQLGRRRRGDGWPRAAISRLLALLVGALAGRRVRDPNVPFRLIERRALERALGRLPAASEVGLLNAALSVVLAETERPRWVPIGFRPRHAGRSHYRPARMARLAAGLLAWQARRRPGRLVAAAAWCALAAAIALYAARNLPVEAVWYDEAMQVHTSIGVDARAAPGTPPAGLRAVVARNRDDQLDPGGYGVLLHAWIGVFGTGVPAMRLASGLLVVAGLAALGGLARRWLGHPLAPPAAVALALVDPLVREHAVEVRPYALEMAAVWVAFWAADRLLARPGPARGAVLGVALVALVGARYTGFVVAAAIGGALLLHLARPGAGAPPPRRRLAALAATLGPPLAAAAIIGRWSVPGLVGRATWEGGALVSYLSPHTARALGMAELPAAALANLLHPAVLALTLVAALAVWSALGRGAGATAASLFVRRAALLTLLATLALWPWLPWAPATKWSLFLRAVSLVCLVRLAADALPWALARPWLRRTAAVAAVGIVAAGAVLAARHERWHWDVALPALERLAAMRPPPGDASVAVDVHPYPGLRVHYELGSLRGRPEYPRAFRLHAPGFPPSPADLCAVDWLLSFRPLRELAAEHPGLRFEEDAAADQLLRVSVADPTACPGGSTGAAGGTARGTSGRVASQR